MRELHRTDGTFSLLETDGEWQVWITDETDSTRTAMLYRVPDRLVAEYHYLAEVIKKAGHCGVRPTDVQVPDSNPLSTVNLLNWIREARDFIEWEPDDEVDKENCAEKELLLDELCDLLRKAGVDNGPSDSP